MVKTFLRLYLKKYVYLLVVLAFIIVYYCAIFQITDRATVLPRLLLYLVIPVVGWNLIKSIYDVAKEAAEDSKTTSKTDGSDSDPFWLKKVIVLALTLVYILLIPVLGFYTITTIYLGVVLFMFGITKPLSIFIYIMIVDLFLFLTFNLWVGLQFPRGILI